MASDGQINGSNGNGTRSPRVVNVVTTGSLINLVALVVSIVAGAIAASIYIGGIKADVAVLQADMSIVMNTLGIGAPPPAAPHRAPRIPP